MARPPLFLARSTYRQRRMMDAARILPVLGALLFALPVVWRPGHNDAGGTAGGGLYLFVIWFGLIAATFLLSRTLARLVGEGAGSEGPTAEDEEDI